MQGWYVLSAVYICVCMFVYNSPNNIILHTVHRRRSVKKTVHLYSLVGGGPVNRDCPSI